MALLLFIASGAILGFIAGTCLSVSRILALSPVVFMAVFLLARFEGNSYGVTLGLSVGAVLILQAAYLAGALLWRWREVPAKQRESSSTYKVRRI
jgi:hypothetical protein